MSKETKFTTLFERMANAPEDIHKNADVFDLHENIDDLLADSYHADPALFMKVFAPENLCVFPLWLVLEVVNFYLCNGKWAEIRKANKDRVLQKVWQDVKECSEAPDRAPQNL